MIEPLLVAMAFLIGLLFRRIGTPPLLGYLAAGFFAGALNIGDAVQINKLADLGIVLLLFTIGLKLNPRQLMAPQVWAVAGLHTAIVVPLTAAVLMLLHFLIPGLAQLEPKLAWTLAFALSFSSTVFAVKIFDERGEGAALHAKIAIGILIIQDIMAVIYLVATAEHPPSPWAVGLLALPLLRPVMIYFMRQAGHGELLVLFGFSVALGSAALFEVLHLKAGLGALIFGVLLSNASKSAELYKELINFKDIFLTAFFLSVGYYGLPSGQMLVVAVLLSLLIFLRPMIYFGLLLLFRLRARTSMLTGLSLFNYSEFGLIVAALAVQGGVLPAQWLTTLAVAMALSLFVAVPFNTHIHRLYAQMAPRLQRLERKQLLMQERGVDLGDAEIVILGMGRIGSGAYAYLNEHFPGTIVGVEESAEKALKHEAEGLRCVFGDASDRDFLERAELHRRKMLLISLTNHSENIDVVKLLQQLNYRGKIAVVSRFPDQAKELEDMGCITFNLYAEAGHGFAERAMEEIA
ncbi:Kef-type K+ transport system, predicted NAD-binding component [Spongiibacter sp. IMCC21906]|jgi:glutathione-regulated potassium-efflux system ancillary protein KefC|uniref:cation:proton antiporter family protein n=1 Tax=Spongiibacter sp. IMCC21906 TaxID=1620392 RepID=UPI00062DD666|nr:cation:proton antiporter family protein [Spongiibacter sp. IMCC21906]AKH69014.1 Kef-type K+ transport system, predicted NAD-binding component [Spongiibacter sp. IMCC21906]